jgi:uncharacterized OB-fold protein
MSTSDTAAAEWRGPLPNPTEEMRPFWDGLARGELLLAKCRRCGAWRFPLAGCRDHANDAFLANMVWTPASGLGRVLAYTIQRAQIDPAFPVPYVYAVIELAEGPVMVANIARCAPEKVREGMQVQVAFKRLTDEATIPEFEPAVESAS